MKVYIAGPMRGIPDYNFPAFHVAAAVLRAKGHEVVSPAEMDEEEYGGYAEVEAVATKPNALREFMARDLPALLGCEAVVLLPGWEKSQGALIESFVAAMCGLAVMEYIGSRLGGPAVSIYRLLVVVGEKICGGAAK